MKNFNNKIKKISTDFDKLLQKNDKLKHLFVQKNNEIHKISTNFCIDKTSAKYIGDVHSIFCFLSALFQHNEEITKVTIDDKLVEKIISFFFFIETKTTICNNTSFTGEYEKIDTPVYHINHSFNLMHSLKLVDETRYTRYQDEICAILLPKKTLMSEISYQFTELKSRFFYKAGRFANFIRSKISQTFTNNINKKSYMNQPKESFLHSRDDNNVSLLISKESKKTSVLSMNAITENDFEVVYKDEMDVKIDDVGDGWAYVYELKNIQRSKPELLYSINDIDEVLSHSAEESSASYITSIEEDGFEVVSKDKIHAECEQEEYGFEVVSKDEIHAECEQEEDDFEVVSKDEIHAECEREEDGFEVVSKDEIHAECEQEEDGFEVINMPSLQAGETNRSFSISTRIQFTNAKLHNIQSGSDCKVR